MIFYFQNLKMLWFFIIEAVSARLPSYFDLRMRSNYGVTPVKDQHQYQCGSCVAFGVVSAIEGSLYRKYNKTFDLSEGWLVNI